MRTFILLPAIFLLLAAGFAEAKGYEMKGKAGDYSVSVLFEKSPFEEGSNTVEISLLDSASRPVTDATVVLDYFMPTLPDKSSMMCYAVRATLRGEKYVGRVDFPMSGEWSFVVNIIRKGETDAMAFALVAG